MDYARIARHLFAMPGRLARVFPADALAAIEHAVKASETQHSGEIRFAMEAALDPWPLLAGQSARSRALEVFSQLRVWDTEKNNGVLIYLLLADRDVEIVADRGIDARVGARGWEEICRAMEAEFAQGRYREGVLRGVHAVTEQLARHFPPRAGDANELADRPALL